MNFQKINQAYEVLSNQKQREIYNCLGQDDFKLYSNQNKDFKNFFGSAFKWQTEINEKNEPKMNFEPSFEFQKKEEDYLANDEKVKDLKKFLDAFLEDDDDSSDDDDECIHLNEIYKRFSKRHKERTQQFSYFMSHNRESNFFFNEQTTSFKYSTYNNKNFYMENFESQSSNLFFSSKNQKNQDLNQDFGNNGFQMGNFQSSNQYFSNKFMKNNEKDKPDLTGKKEKRDMELVEDEWERKERAIFKILYPKIKSKKPIFNVIKEQRRRKI